MLAAMTRVHRLLVVAGAAAILAGTTFALQAQDVPESVMSCVATGSKVGHTWIQHADPASLKEAVRIYETKAENVDYPEGTVFRLIPQEAMIKRSTAAFPSTNGWEVPRSRCHAAGNHGARPWRRSLEPAGHLQELSLGRDEVGRRLRRRTRLYGSAVDRGADRDAAEERSTLREIGSRPANYFLNGAVGRSILRLHSSHDPR